MNTKEKLVDSLIKNHGWKEDDRSMLLAHNEDFLDKLVKNYGAQQADGRIKSAVAEGTSGKRTDTTNPDEEGVEEAEDKKKKKTQNAAAKKKAGVEKDDDEDCQNLSVEDWLENSNAPEPVKAMIANQLREQEVKKAGFITKITANKSCRFTKEELQLLDADALEKMAALAETPAAPRRANFGGANGGGLSALNNSAGGADYKQKALPTPVMNFESPASK